MKIVREYTPALCILGLVSGMPVLANQAGLTWSRLASVKIRTLAESGTCTQAPVTLGKYTL
jgi:hypothetical protein